MHNNTNSSSIINLAGVLLKVQMSELHDNLAILRDMCDRHGCAIRGTKAQLKDRLIAKGVKIYSKEGNHL